jgi:ABC-type Fe3+/spermidine/putrescine transport system ATPase subunit
MSERILFLDKVCKWYGRRVVIRDVTIEAHQGDFLCILGRSGSGKSTLLKMIAGLVRPSAGKIKIGQDDVTELGIGRRDVGYIFQDSDSLFPHLNVLNNVAFPLRYGRFKDPNNAVQRAREVLEWLEMPREEDKKITELSGGQRQRVAIARTFAYSPKLFLLDEPLNSLDSVLKETTISMLSELHKKTGGTFLYVTHDEREAVRLATKLAILHDGHIEQIGSVESVTMEPASLTVAQAVGDWNTIGVAESDWDGWASPLKGGAMSRHRGKKGHIAFRVNDTAVIPMTQGKAATEIASESDLVLPVDVVRTFLWYGYPRAAARLQDGTQVYGLSESLSVGQDATMRTSIKKIRWLPAKSEVQ